MRDTALIAGYQVGKLGELVAQVAEATDRFRDGELRHSPSTSCCTRTAGGSRTESGPPETRTELDGVRSPAQSGTAAAVVSRAPSRWAADAYDAIDLCGWPGSRLDDPGTFADRFVGALGAGMDAADHHGQGHNPGHERDRKKDLGHSVPHTRHTPA